MHSKAQYDAGRARYEGALWHIQRAITELNAAMRDLCSVTGANDDYRALKHVERELRRAQRDCAATIDTAIPSPRLDHEPEDAQDAGCHGGCGGVK